MRSSKAMNAVTPQEVWTRAYNDTLNKDELS